MPSEPTAPFEQCPNHGIEPLSGAIAPAGAQGGAGVKTNKEDKNKCCVEILKMFYSLVFKVATPTKAGEFLVRCPERIHCKYRALRSRLKSRGDKEV